MRSASDVRRPRSDDLTARSRIRDAALHRFAVDGFAGTSVRSVAEDAGVSPALVIHHFGSKEGLRTACDEHVVAMLTETKSDALDGPMDGSALLRALEGSADVVAYLGRSLTDGSPQAAGLFDSMVTMTAALLEQAERAGGVRPTADPVARAAVLTTWGLSLLALRVHLERALGVSLTTTQGLLRVERVAADLYTNGLFTDSRWVDVVDDATTASSTPDRRRDSGPRPRSSTPEDHHGGEA